MDAGRTVKRAVHPSPVISDIPASSLRMDGGQRQRRPARGAVSARPVSAGRKDERWCHCTTPVQGTGFIGFRGRDTTMGGAAQLRASTGSC